MCVFVCVRVRVFCVWVCVRLYLPSTFSNGLTPVFSLNACCVQCLEHF